MSFTDHDRSDSLKNLPTLEAIRAWLADDFSHRDEYNLVTAILRDRRVPRDHHNRSLPWPGAATGSVPTDVAWALANGYCQVLTGKARSGFG